MQINLTQLWDRQPLKKASAPASRKVRWSRWLPVAVFAVFLATWELVVHFADYPTYILPTPDQVARKFVLVLLDGTLIYHTGVTLLEVLGGLILGVSVATVLGYALAKSVAVERALSPYLVASQAVPIVAIAPLLVIWFGPGLSSKILISALIVFFPILINTIAGVRDVPADLHDLMRSLHATRWQVFTRLEVPSALPVLLAGLKVGATLSVIGAVVGEFAGASAGLGVMISVADGQYDTARMFVGVMALVVLALSLYGLVYLLEKRLLSWRSNGAG
jgi:NitT/TauT family transport system permease protein